jgi:aspartate/tyrosine/aromatic aminotransferase
MATFRFFDDEGNFNAADLSAQIAELAKSQDQVLLLLNTPAHNPTGYALSLEDWDRVIEVLNNAPVKVALFLDIAYIDYAGEDDEVRAFLPKLKEFTDSVFVMFGYSASKTLTAYGMRCGAIVCMAKDEESANEFRKTAEFTARSTWSNCNRSAQVVMGKIYSDPELEAKVSEERRGYRDMLLERGRAFEEALNEEGVSCVPFKAGFFVTVECDDPAGVCAKLEDQDIFCLALPKGIRISVASVSKEKCVKCAKAIAALIR